MRASLLSHHESIASAFKSHLRLFKNKTWQKWVWGGGRGGRISGINKEAKFGGEDEDLVSFVLHSVDDDDDVDDINNGAERRSIAFNLLPSFPSGETESECAKSQVMKSARLNFFFFFFSDFSASSCFYRLFTNKIKGGAREKKKTKTTSKYKDWDLLPLFLLLLYIGAFSSPKKTWNG